MNDNHMKVNNQKLKTALWLGTGTVAIALLLFAIKSYVFHQAANANYIPEEETEEAIEMQILKERKARILENSYYTSLALGQEYEDKNEPDIAMFKYLDAKSIYPTAVEPRIALSKLYYSYALNYSDYCWQAKKEILYALRYVRRSEYPKEYTNLKLWLAEIEKKCGKEGNYAFLDDLNISR